MDNIDSGQNTIIESFQSLSGKEELLTKVIEFFPYPIQVYSPDGTSVLVNKAMLKEYHTSDANLVVGRYNIFKDPAVIATGQFEMLKRAFAGETVIFRDIRVPLEDIAERYGVKDLDTEAIYQDITVFPILDEQKRVIYVAAFLINKRIYRGRDDIEKAKEFIESRWLEKFDADKTAKAACLSKAHFTKLFRKHTGVTPHDYYVNYKISKVKEILMDPNLTIMQAFNACNLEYNGYTAGVFKRKTGFSPSAFRNMTL